MDELDFTGPACSEETDQPDLARKCFESVGKTEDVSQGGSFFTEGQTSDRMYLLVEGEVSLVRGGKTLDIVRAGEIFGEMAAITGQPRTASAVARSACKALSLEANQLQQAVQSAPEFALLLMGIMNNRLRLTIALLGRKGAIAESNAQEEAPVFDKKSLDELTEALRARPPQTYPRNRQVMKEGEPGMSMYVVLRGKVAVAIKGTLVGRVGSGGVFGEMALVDQSPRAASASAEDESVLLAINRNDFLTLIKTKPAFAVSLLRAVADRLRHMTAQKK